MRKDVTMNDLLIAGAYYRLLKDVASSFEIHLANKVFKKEEMGKVFNLVKKIRDIETDMGLEANLFKFIKSNSDNEQVKDVIGHEGSVFYGPVHKNYDTTDPVNMFIIDFLKEEYSFVDIKARLDSYLIEPAGIVDDKVTEWRAIAKGNANAINYLEDIIMNIYKRDHKNEED